MKHRITFSQIPSLQRISHGANRFEAVCHGRDEPIEVWADTKRATLPDHVMAELARRFNEVHMQDKHAQEFYLMEAKPCTI